MKRLFAVILSVVMVISLAACGSKEKAEKYCFNCGEGITKSATFCEHCGTAVNGESSDNSSSNTSTNKTSLSKTNLQ